MKKAWRMFWTSFCLAAFAPMFSGCGLFSQFSPTKDDKADIKPMAGAPSQHSLRVSQFIFISDVEMQKDQPLFKDLSSLRDQVYRELKLPASNTEIWVYLFETKAAYKRFLDERYPNLPFRRAYFVKDSPVSLGSGAELAVYTYKNEETPRDLRHELTHAMLHCVLRKVPIWLDEGLAEYFEVPAAKNGLNARHLAPLRESGIRFDLARLEGLKEVRQMEPAEYRESWGWVHLMMHSTPKAKQALLGYLRDLRNMSDPPSLAERLAPAFPSPEQSLVSHLSGLERKLARN